MLVAFSMPSRPGDELTSITTGPWLDRNRSTPATARPVILAARDAVDRSSGVSLITSAEPPRCRLDRNSPGGPCRRIEAITRPPTTKARMSAPLASLMYSWTRMLASSWRNAPMTDSAAFLVSARTTPMPWVPSSSLTTTGAPPTVSSRPSMSLVEWAKPVTGSPIPPWLSSCSDRSLSRLRLIAWLPLTENTFIISNCRTTAVP